MSKPRILLLDIETAPSLGYVWGKYDQNVIAFEREWYILCFSVKWLGEKKVYTYSLPGYKEAYKKDREDDYQLCRELWKYFDQADIIIAHNGDQFDLRKSNARFISHGLLPPSSYKSVDTLKLARKYFKFDSNKLADLASSLGVGEKLASGGFGTWKGCMLGDVASWTLMRKYNAKDVAVLEGVYLKLRPWSVGHPNLSLYNGNVGSCPTCQSKAIQKRGFSYAVSQVRQRFHCTGCGSWFSGAVVKKVSTGGKDEE